MILPLTTLWRPMHVFVLVLLFSGLVSPTGIKAQQQCTVGPIIGNVHGERVRITNSGLNNAAGCSCSVPYFGPYTLHLLESAQPSLRLSWTADGAASETACTGASHGTLSVYRGVLRTSAIESINDFTITAGTNDGASANLILASRSPGSAVKLATTPVGSATDVERLTITGKGEIGIAQTAPKALLHIGGRMTITSAPTTWDVYQDYIGFNVYTDGEHQRLLYGTGAASVQAHKIGTLFNGPLMIGCGSTMEGRTDDVIDWYEGGEKFVNFSGLTIRQEGGYASASFGRFWPDHTTRLLVRAAPSHTKALAIQDTNGIPLVHIMSDGKTGIGNPDPRALLDIRAPERNSNPILRVERMWIDDQHHLRTLPVMQITANGNVVIGEKQCTTDVPAEPVRLHVDGATVAREFYVTQSAWSWPDYVFHDDYHLQPLSELKAFVHRERHLPDIPSAANIERTGVPIGEMQTRLLKKIEELTLYMIQLAEENANLRMRVESLERTRE